MKQRKILNLISSAVDKTAPDCWSNIKKATENSERGIKNMSEIITESKNTKKGLFMGISMAAAVAVVIGSTTIFASAMSKSYIALDINPSIELESNAFGTITDVYGVNEDAKELIEDMDIEGEKIESAVETIIEKAIEDGYVSDEKDNAILVSVDGKKPDKAEQIKEKVTDSIDNVLEENVIEATVKTQNVNIDKEIIEEAHTKGVSVGRLTVIERIMQEDGTVKLEEISKISVKDLLEYADENDIELDDLLDSVEDAYNNIVDDEEKDEEKDNNNNKNKDKEFENNKYKTKFDSKEGEEINENSNRYKDKEKEEQEKEKEEQEKEREEQEELREAQKEEREKEREAQKEEREKEKEEQEKQREIEKENNKNKDDHEDDDIEDEDDDDDDDNNKNNKYKDKEKENNKNKDDYEDDDDTEDIDDKDEDEDIEEKDDDNGVNGQSINGNSGGKSKN